MISTGGSVRKTACENASSQAVRNSDTALFTLQARDNSIKKGASALYSFLLVRIASFEVILGSKNSIKKFHKLIQ